MTFRKYLYRFSKSIAYTGYVLSILFLVLSVVLSLGIKPVMADEGDAAEPETPASEPAVSEPAGGEVAAPVEVPSGDDDDAMASIEEPIDDDAAPVEEPADMGVDAAPVEESVNDGEDAAPGEEPALTDQSLAPVEAAPVSSDGSDSSSESGTEDTPATEAVTDVVELLGNGGKQLVNENGDVIPLASAEAEQALAGKDPFFWNGTKWVGYTVDGTGCPANVECIRSDTPFQAAVDNAPAGAMIYVAQGEYHETVTINKANQSFTAFTLIEALLDGSIGSYVSGYASVDKFILNAIFGDTNGVYGKEIVVNNGGRLDDGLSLVEKDGHVTANVKLISSGDYYIIQDANDASISFEWECGEPDMSIYPGAGNIYQMVFKAPLDPDIVNYYTATSPDERGFGMSATDRLNDLMIAVNVSTQDNWSTDDEKLIFWYLLGNRTYEGEDIWSQLMDNSQRDKTFSILNGSNDTIALNRGIWFLWPTLQNGQSVSPFNRQLTFINYSNRVIRGCTDDGSDNYNPNATVDDDSCITIRYGCTDETALNYNPAANTDDGSCSYITGDDDDTDDDDLDDDDSGDDDDVTGDDDDDVTGDDDDDVTGDDDDVTVDDDDTPGVGRETGDDDFAGGGPLPQYANEIVPTLAAPGDSAAVASEMMLPVTGIDLGKGAANPALFFNLSLVSLGIGMIAHTVTKKQRDE
jgi:hypothetical protein